MYYKLDTKLSEALSKSMSIKPDKLTSPTEIRTITPRDLLLANGRITTRKKAIKEMEKYRRIGNFDLDKFTTEAIQAGYVDSNGTPDLVMASLVTERYGRCVPKERLSPSDFEYIQAAIRKIDERLNLKKDTFQKGEV